MWLCLWSKAAFYQRVTLFSCLISDDFWRRWWVWWNNLISAGVTDVLSLSGGARLQGGSYFWDGAAAHGPADNGTLSGPFPYERRRWWAGRLQAPDLRQRSLHPPLVLPLLNHPRLQRPAGQCRLLTQVFQSQFPCITCTCVKAKVKQLGQAYRNRYHSHVCEALWSYCQHSVGLAHEWPSVNALIEQPSCESLGRHLRTKNQALLIH